jgi:uroporphyrinogen-III decarboxylase
MAEINRLLDELGTLCDSAENKRRLALWSHPERGIRAETQWHGLPAYTAATGRAMPVTAECLEKMWEQVLGMDIRRFYTDPDYYLEYFLKYKILKFKRFADDTPLTRDVPVCFGVTHEAGVLGQRVIFMAGEEPQFAKEPIVDEGSVLPARIDFGRNPYLAMAVPFYRRVQSLAGGEFRVIFPQWYRGPQGVALYIRGFQNFAVDMHVNPDFARRLLRYVTDAAKQYDAWRSEFTGEPIEPCDLFNDDVPLMSPESYASFFRDLEQELTEFHGGCWYWHSCGDITRHVAEVGKLKGISLLDFGVTMEDKAEGLKGLARSGGSAGVATGGALAAERDAGGPAIEFRVMAKRHIQEAAEAEQKEYLRSILHACRVQGVQRYVIRSSGMSILLGGEPDLAKLARWVELAREVQEEIPAGAYA